MITTKLLKSQRYFVLTATSLSFPLNNLHTTQVSSSPSLTISLKIIIQDHYSKLNPPRWQWAESTNKLVHSLQSTLLWQVTCLIQHPSTSSKSHLLLRSLNAGKWRVSYIQAPIHPQVLEPVSARIRQQYNWLIRDVSASTDDQSLQILADASHGGYRLVPNFVTV